MESAFCAPPPLRVTIDCLSNEDSLQYSDSGSDLMSGLNVDSFCHMIHKAIPKAIKNGRFVRLESDQYGDGDTEYPVAMAPPIGFIPKLPKFKKPKLGVPSLSVPKLRPSTHKSKLPKLATQKSIDFSKDSHEDESSAEKMEIFKKGVQKLLHVVKVLGQIDQYLSERTRIIVDKLSKTFSD